METRRPDREQKSWSRTRCSLNIASDPPRSNWRASTSHRPLRCEEAHVLEPLRCAWWRSTGQTSVCGWRDRALAQVRCCWPPPESPRRPQQSDVFTRWWHQGSEDEDCPFWDTSTARMKTENIVATEDGAKNSQWTDMWGIAPPSASDTETRLSGWGTHSWVDAEARVAPLADASILEPNSAACTIRPPHTRRACILMQAETERVAMRQSTRFFHCLFFYLFLKSTTWKLWIFWTSWKKPFKFSPGLLLWWSPLVLEKLSFSPAHRKVVWSSPSCYFSLFTFVKMASQKLSPWKKQTSSYLLLIFFFEKQHSLSFFNCPLIFRILCVCVFLIFSFFVLLFLVFSFFEVFQPPKKNEKISL